MSRMLRLTLFILTVTLYCISGPRTSVVATPLPFPMPMALMSPDYTSRWPAYNRSSAFNLARNLRFHHALNASYDGDATIHLEDSAILTRRKYQDKIAALYGHYATARTSSSNLKRLATQSAFVDAADLDFQQSAVSELTAFDTSILGIKTILDDLGAEKGLKNYDRTNDIETLLKNLVNFHKDTFSAVYTLVNNLPILGPLLGPIVYEIKCILDDVLNAVENISDAIINGLQPLLAALIGQASTTACRSGVVLAGLCI